MSPKRQLKKPASADQSDATRKRSLQLKLSKLGPLSDEEASHVVVDQESEAHFYCNMCHKTDGEVL
jgi:hypothetical protein